MVLDKLEMEKPKTREMEGVLAALGVNSSALIVLDKSAENVVKSARNLAGVKTLPASILNVVDILAYKRLLMTEAAVRRAEELWGKSNASL
jgi:large subunit ribosomal protein L4